MKNFFYFGSKLVMSTFQAEPIGLRNESIAEINNLFLGKYESINFPLIFKQSGGKKLTDILDTGHVLYLISDKLKKIIEDNNFTGWLTYLIKLYDKKENEIKGYHGFSVKGVCGPRSFENSVIIYKKLIPNGPLCKFYRGVQLGLDQWDGSDFFTSRDSLRTIVTKKVADILKKNSITNLELINLAEMETNELAISEFLARKRE